MRPEWGGGGKRKLTFLPRRWTVTAPARIRSIRLSSDFAVLARFAVWRRITSASVWRRVISACCRSAVAAVRFSSALLAAWYWV